MPTYTFRNKKNGKEHTEFMSMADMEALLAKGEYEFCFNDSPKIISGRMGANKPPQAFNDVLREMKKKVGKNDINIW